MNNLFDTISSNFEQLISKIKIYKFFVLTGLVIVVLVIGLSLILNNSISSLKGENEPPAEEPTSNPTEIVQVNTIPTVQPSVLPLPTKAPSFQRNIEMDKNISPESKPSTLGLTQSEMAYPKGQTQVFAGRDTTERGNLIVTSDMPDVTVRINIPDESESGAESFVPVNNAPFSEAIPPGYYLIDAGKAGYDQSEFIIRIEPNKVTRLRVALRPL